MGFIAEGSTLNWQDAAKQSKYVREHGIIQLLHIYKKYKDRRNDKLTWGDEVCRVGMSGFVVECVYLAGRKHGDGACWLE